MSTEIEKLDKKRLRYIELYLVGMLSFLALTILRLVQRATDVNAQSLGGLLLVGMVLSLIFCFVSVIGMGIQAKKIRQNSRLKEALYNEHVRVIESNSWIAAFAGTSLTTIVFAILSSFAPQICDPVTISLNSIIVGLFTQRASFYIRYRML